MENLIHTTTFQGSNIKALETGKLPDTPLETINEYLRELKRNQQRWAQDYPIEKRIELLKRTLVNFNEYKDEWGQADLLARHVPEGHWSTQESLAQPLVTMGITQLYIQTLSQILENGATKPFLQGRQDGNRVILDSFPRSPVDMERMPGARGEIHLLKGTKLEDLPSLQAVAYKDKSYKGSVSLVLAAGNVSFLTINDLYHKLFNEKKVVIIKSNPVLEYMGPLLEKMLAPFIEEGFVRIAMGGSKEGHHLATHPLVDDIHMTGSDKTFEAIVYGGGEEGKKNKATDTRLNTKPLSAELGNVTPVIVVPGTWEESDFDVQADNLISMFSVFNSYACLAMRVLILPKNWDGSEKLLAKFLDKMSKKSPSVNYYPGTKQTLSEAMSCYPQAIKFGQLDDQKQPWVVAKGLDSEKDEMAFNREFWASFTSQTYIDGATKDEYLLNAVKFANEKLWGTLAAAIIIDPQSEAEMLPNNTLRKAIDDLHYGTVAINTGPSAFIRLMVNPWGGYPGSSYSNIQSGNCFVANPLMIENVEKSVVFAPFRKNS